MPSDFFEGDGLISFLLYMPLMLSLNVREYKQAILRGKSIILKRHLTGQTLSYCSSVTWQSKTLQNGQVVLVIFESQ